jgi:hypothetical protein
MTRTHTGVAAIVLAALALGACAKPAGPGSPTPDTPASPTAERHNLVDEGYSGRFRVSGTVLESPDHGPQLCHSVMDSLPPQCGGPDIKGWDWKAVKSDSASGTRWGQYVLTGTYDATRNRFTLTEPADNRVESTAKPAISSDDGSPCPTPAGGWRPADPAKATMESQNTVSSLARSDPDFGGMWLDQSYIQPGDPMDSWNDPKKYVLNVTFTKDLPRHEAELRKVWGGALCVSKAPRSMKQMERIRGEVEPQVKGMLYSSIDELTDVLSITVPIATTAQQRDLDSRYGEGAVALESWFEPID